MSPMAIAPARPHESIEAARVAFEEVIVVAVIHFIIVQEKNNRSLNWGCPNMRADHFVISA